jgi:hypothetical protein
MNGSRAPAWSISKVRLGNVLRQTPGDQPAPKPNNYDEAAKKLGEAFLKTGVGKKLTDAAKQDPLVKGAEGFIDTLPGKIIAGTAAVGAVSALAATHTALPAQIPEISLDSIRPGLSVKITYEGPADHPTKAAITFSYSPKGETKKPKQTASERYRAETARIAAEQENLRAGMKYKPGSAEDLQQKMEQKAIEDYTLRRFGALPGTGATTLAPTYPALQGSPDTGLRLPTFESPFKPKRIHVLDQQLQLQPLTSSNAPSEDEKKEEATLVQRKAAGDREILAVPPIVYEILRSPGEPLDAATRAFMEPRVGCDFSRVRVHTDERAAISAGAMVADAYTVGQHVVFAGGRYRPATEGGRQLIAHELIHVLQQGDEPVPARLNVGSASSPLESQADTISHEALASDKSQGTPAVAGPTAQLRDGSEETAQLGSVSNHFHAFPASESRRSLAHEVAHVQARSSAAKGVIQRRRLPPGAALGGEVPAAAAGFDEARKGMARAISRAWAELTAAQQANVKAATTALGITWTTEADLLTKLESATRAQLLSLATAIRTEDPTAELGDPLLIDTGARPGTSDAANITSLVTRANTVFAAIAGGAKDADLTQVFGAANIATAKTKYANAKTRMNSLKAANKIVTDRSGYAAEVGLGGLSNSAQISVAPSTIDNPTDKESIVTLIHESMHAGNIDVSDKGYISQPSFKDLAVSVKLTNAAHFEVVPRRILGASFAFAGQTFVPAGTTVGGVSAPALTPRQQAIREASETFRLAWTAGLNLHKLFVRLFRTPAEWSTLDLSTAFAGAAAGAHFSDTLPFWSKVEMLTIHTRAGSVNPAGTPAVKPVTQIDIALSEGLTRRLSQGMNSVPQTEGVALAFESAHASSAELTASAASVNAERDLLIRLVVRVILGSITGGVSRDEKVVARLAAAARAPNFTDYLAIRSSSAFP